MGPFWAMHHPHPPSPPGGRGALVCREVVWPLNLTLYQVMRTLRDLDFTWNQPFPELKPQLLAELNISFPYSQPIWDENLAPLPLPDDARAAAVFLAVNHANISFARSAAISSAVRRAAAALILTSGGTEPRAPRFTTFCTT